MENNDLRLMISIIVVGLVTSVGIGFLVALIVIGDREGATWAWWQVMAAAVSGSAAALTSIPIAVYAALRTYGILGAP